MEKIKITDNTIDLLEGSPLSIQQIIWDGTFQEIIKGDEGIF